MFTFAFQRAFNTHFYSIFRDIYSSDSCFLFVCFCLFTYSFLSTEQRIYDTQVFDINGEQLHTYIVEFNQYQYVSSRCNILLLKKKSETFETCIFSYSDINVLSSSTCTGSPITSFNMSTSFLSVLHTKTMQV